DREVLALRCLWYGALGSQPVQVVLSRPVGACDGYELALVTTDLAATPQVIIERYADRWSAEQAFLEARHLVGGGQARTRTPPLGGAPGPLRPLLPERGDLLVRP